MSCNCGIEHPVDISCTAAITRQVVTGTTTDYSQDASRCLDCDWTYNPAVSYSTLHSCKKENEMTLYEVAIVDKGNEKKDRKPGVILEPTPVIARTKEMAIAKAAIFPAVAAEDLDHPEIEILVREFN